MKGPPNILLTLPLFISWQTKAFSYHKVSRVLLYYKPFTFSSSFLPFCVSFITFWLSISVHLHLHLHRHRHLIHAHEFRSFICTFFLIHSLDWYDGFIWYSDVSLEGINLLFLLRISALLIFLLLSTLKLSFLLPSLYYI